MKRFVPVSCKQPRWVQSTLPSQWFQLALKAAAWQDGDDFDHLNEVLDFIRYTLQRAGIPLPS